VVSKINLVDLAGSERHGQAKTTGDRLRVCMSLTSLIRCRCVTLHDVEL